MKAPHRAKNPIPETEVYRGFMRLDRERRRHLAVRILRSQKVMADLYDHFLIQRSLDEPGSNLTWESYSRTNGSRR